MSDQNVDEQVVYNLHTKGTKSVDTELFTVTSPIWVLKNRTRMVDAYQKKNEIKGN